MRIRRRQKTVIRHVAGSTAALGAPRNAYVLSAGPGSYSIAGAPATLSLSRRLAAEAGTYQLTGAAANLTYSAQPPAAAPPARSGSGAGEGRLRRRQLYPVIVINEAPRHIRMSAAAGVYSITGAPVEMRRNALQRPFMAALARNRRLPTERKFVVVKDCGSQRPPIIRLGRAEEILQPLLKTLPKPTAPRTIEQRDNDLRKALAVMLPSRSAAPRSKRVVVRADRDGRPVMMAA